MAHVRNKDYFGISRDYVDTGDVLYSKRILQVSGNVGSTEGADLLADLLCLEQIDITPIHLYVSSFGGSVHGALALIDIMNHMKPAVHTYSLGHSMSAGAWIVSQGTPGFRYAFPNSTLMIHQVSSGGMGKIDDLEISTKETKRLNTLLVAMLAKATGKSPSKINKDTKQDLYLSAQDALKYGLVDKIIGE